MLKGIDACKKPVGSNILDLLKNDSDSDELPIELDQDKKPAARSVDNIRELDSNINSDDEDR